MAHQNIFAGNPLDRAGDLRNDPDWLAEQADKPYAQALVLWEGRPLIEETDQGPRLVWLSMKHARTLVRDREVFLGLWKDEPVFAIEFEGSIDPADGPVGGLGVFHDMRSAAALLPAADAAMAGGAKSLFDWRRKHGFCANCGALCETASGGWKRRCPACGTEHFPRVDPVVIMLAEREGKVLVGRGPRFPANFFSALAGFVEPGESLEEAVARELFEEAGIRVHGVRLGASQPWPFPSSLMMGAFAQADGFDLTLDESEIADARWVTKDEVRAALSGNADWNAPPPLAIAHWLLATWAASAD